MGGEERGRELRGGNYGEEAEKVCRREDMWQRKRKEEGVKSVEGRKRMKESKRCVERRKRIREESKRCVEGRKRREER